VDDPSGFDMNGYTKTMTAAGGDVEVEGGPSVMHTVAHDLVVAPHPCHDALKLRLEASQTQRRREDKTRLRQLPRPLSARDFHTAQNSSTRHMFSSARADSMSATDLVPFPASRTPSIRRMGQTARGPLSRCERNQDRLPSEELSFLASSHRQDAISFNICPETVS